MAERRCHRHVESEYRFDRLGTTKLAQVYRALVPEEMRAPVEILSGGFHGEVRRNLRTRIIRAPKTRANDR